METNKNHIDTTHLYLNQGNLMLLKPKTWQQQQLFKREEWKSIEVFLSDSAR